MGTPPQARPFPGVYRQPKKRYHVLYLSTVVERRAPHHPIGDAPLEKELLYPPREGIQAIENGHVPIAVPLAPQGLDLAGDERGLVPLALYQEHPHRFPPISGGPEVFLRALGVAVDQRVGRIQYDPRGSVVLVQHHRAGPGKVLGKAQNHPHVCPAPAVNGLIRIPHRHQLLFPLHQPSQSEVLEAIHVLVFVHQHPIKGPLLPLAHLLFHGEQV